ncbi:hypothetical protein GCM10025780_24480 [Frondihabitans cladoniiphilus]|uniref:Phage holin family protein n=2 Tax=Frondihabitans cladoniiphilus TaxID=715785 RepID=A0ABP8W263_9MICO
MLVVAALFAFLVLEVLVAAAILALTAVFTPWLSALLVAAGLLIVAALFGLAGYRMLKKGTPPVPSETVKNLKSDVRTLRGEDTNEPENG